MTTKTSKDKEIVMEFVERRFMALIDKSDLNDVAKKSMQVRLEERLDTVAKALVADFKVLADHLVSEKQVCNKCGNEIYFDRYATYPQAKINLPKNFGKPQMLETIDQIDPKD